MPSFIIRFLCHYLRWLAAKILRDDVESWHTMMLLTGIDYYLGMFERAGHLHRRNIKQNLDFSRVITFQPIFNRNTGLEGITCANSATRHQMKDPRTSLFPTQCHQFLPCSLKELYDLYNETESYNCTAPLKGIWRDWECHQCLKPHLLKNTVKTTICQSELKIHAITSWVLDGSRKNRWTCICSCTEGKGVQLSSVSKSHLWLIREKSNLPLSSNNKSRRRSLIYNVVKEADFVSKTSPVQGFVSQTDFPVSLTSTIWISRTGWTRRP